MMGRFHAYLDKVFQFPRLAARLTDSRRKPLIPTKAIFGTAFAMFATGRGSLNGIDSQRHFPGRLQNFVGPHVPSGDTVGRVYAQLDSSVLREVLRDDPPAHETQQSAAKHRRLGIRRRGRPRVFSPAANAVATSA